MSTINFVIPIKNYTKIPDIKSFNSTLSETLSSVARQGAGHKIWIIPSEGMELPELPPNARVIYVPPSDDNLPPPKDREELYTRIKMDKGRRVLEAVKRIRDRDEYVMVVDDDDLLHQDLAKTISELEGPEVPGFYIKYGYGYVEEHQSVFEIVDFHKICGTSLIIKAKYFLLNNPAFNASHKEIVSELGSHVISPGRMARYGLRLTAIPYQAAIYRLNNKNSTQALIQKHLGERATTMQALRGSASGLFVADRGLRQKFWLLPDAPDSVPKFDNRDLNGWILKSFHGGLLRYDSAHRFAIDSDITYHVDAIRLGVTKLPYDTEFIHRGGLRYAVRVMGGYLSARSDKYTLTVVPDVKAWEIFTAFKPQDGV